jgi:hypothetical protein
VGVVEARWLSDTPSLPFGDGLLFYLFWKDAMHVPKHQQQRGRRLKLSVDRSKLGLMDGKRQSRHKRSCHCHCMEIEGISWSYFMHIIECWQEASSKQYVWVGLYSVD